MVSSEAGGLRHDLLGTKDWQEPRRQEIGPKKSGRKGSGKLQNKSGTKIHATYLQLTCKILATRKGKKRKRKKKTTKTIVTINDVGTEKKVRKRGDLDFESEEEKWLISELRNPENYPRGKRAWNWRSALKAVRARLRENIYTASELLQFAKNYNGGMQG